MSVALEENKTLSMFLKGFRMIPVKQKITAKEAHIFYIRLVLIKIQACNDYKTIPESLNIWPLKWTEMKIQNNESSKVAFD